LDAAPGNRQSAALQGSLLQTLKHSLDVLGKLALRNLFVRAPKRFAKGIYHNIYLCLAAFVHSLRKETTAVEVPGSHPTPERPPSYAANG
jgi:hypothetical protein